MLRSLEGIKNDFTAQLLVKFENENGVRNINEISSASDIMIALRRFNVNMDICDFHLLQNNDS